jgi:hypothetical protein
MRQSRVVRCRKNKRATSSPRVATPTFLKIALSWSCTSTVTGADAPPRRRRELARDELGHLAFPVAQAVGVSEQRHELMRLGRLDHHGDARVGLIAGE